MKSRSIGFSFVSALAALAVLAMSASAQTVFGHDATGAAVELQTPPLGPCAYPGKGPMLGSFPTSVDFGCPLPGAVTPAAVPLGDVAFDKVTDTVWVTDGLVIGNYTATGAPLSGFDLPVGFALPGPVTGMGFDPLAGELWITDGTMATCLVPPRAPGCTQPVIAMAPFPLPIGAAATDIEWDPFTASLWVCDTGGMITNVLPGGTLGPMGAFPAAGTGCVLALPLQGLAVDTTVASTLYVTDGFLMSRVRVSAPGIPVAAPATFYAPVSCYIAGGPPLNGLAFTGHGINFAEGLDDAGAQAPRIGSIGNAYLGNPVFCIKLTGSVPGSLAFCFYSSGQALCPPSTLFGLPALLLPPRRLGVALIDGDGSATLGVPVGSIPIGTPIWLQWLAVTPLPSTQVSDGLAITIGLP